MKQESYSVKTVSVITDKEESSDAYINDASLANSESSDRNAIAKESTKQITLSNCPELSSNSRYRGGSVGSKPVGKVVGICKKDIGDEQNGQCNSRSMLVFAFVLAAVLALIIFRSMGIGLPGRQTRGLNEPDTVRIKGSVSDIKIDWEIPKSTGKGLVLFGHKRSQPVRVTRLTQPKQSRRPSTIVVKGIIYSNDYKSAIIGKKNVTIGEKVMGADIVNITRRSVEFRKDAVSWTQNVGK